MLWCVLARIASLDSGLTVSAASPLRMARVFLPCRVRLPFEVVSDSKVILLPCWNASLLRWLCLGAMKVVSFEVER